MACGLMNCEAVEPMCIPRDDGDGAGTKEEGDWTCNAGLLGEGAIMLLGEGVITG